MTCIMVKHLGQSRLAGSFCKLSADVTIGCRGFPVEQFKGDRLGQVLAFWGLGIVLGRPLVSQTDYTEDGKTFGECRGACSMHLN